MDPVTDLRDTRVLIPRARRALEGPEAVSGSAAIAEGNLSDQQVNNIIADAIGDVIFYTGGLFGHDLVVEDRDDHFKAPVAWIVDPALSEAEATVIVAQAALNHFFNLVRDMKTQERMSNANLDWEYSFSPQLLTEQIKALQRARDQALERISADETEDLDSWYSLIAERDARTSSLIEPWAYHGSNWGGTVFSGVWW